MKNIANKIMYIVFALIIVALGFSISHWTKNPMEPYVPHHDNSKNCMQCHQNSISQDAWAGAPEWHTEKFSNPILNAENREEHRSSAHDHRNECMMCHAPNFQSKCANCHTSSEW